jgi:hypothetical protein
MSTDFLTPVVTIFRLTWKRTDEFSPKHLVSLDGPGKLGPYDQY